MKDLRFALRTLLRNPGFFTLCVLCLALGIGANTVIFSVVKGVLLDPLPFADAERLVLVYESRDPLEDQWRLSSPANFLDWKARAESFAAMTSYYAWAVNLTGRAEPERLRVGYVSEDFFETLGVDAARGRVFNADDFREGKTAVAVLSDRMWRERLGGAPDVLGQSLQIDNQPRVILGVMPPGFALPAEAELWLPEAIDPLEASRGSREVSVIARLRPDTTVEQARAEMTAVSTALAAEHPEANAGFLAYLTPLHETIVGDVRPVLLVLLGCVGFVLLVACANVTNLLLARAVSREREIALRTAIGASRWALVRQLLAESLVLAGLGGAAGVLLAYWGVRSIVLSSPERMIPRLDQIGLDGGVLAFTAALALLTGLAAGLAPALRASRPDLNRSLKDRSADAVQAGSGSLRLLVVLEITLAVVLLIGAALMIKSFVRLQGVDPGFKPDHVLKMDLSLPGHRYQEEEQVRAFFEQAVQRLRNIPGVTSAGNAALLPLGGGASSRRFLVDGTPPPAVGEEPMAAVNTIDPGYLQTLGIPVLQGRAFTPQDNADAPPVALVNQTMARRFFPGANPVGRRIRFVRPRDPQPPWMTIVGVVGDARQVRLNEEATEQIYKPYAQDPLPFQTLVIRTATEPMALAADARNVIRELDRDLPVSKIQTLEQHLAASIARPRFSTFLLGILAGLALVLAMAGVYGVMSYSVSRRVHEIGIRMTLGAQRGDMLRLVVRQALVLALAGAALGLLAALALTRLLESMLFEVSIKDPAVFLAVPLALIAVAFLASYLPARRATRVDPLEAIRYG